MVKEHKCPECGATIGEDDIDCPECGYLILEILEDFQEEQPVVEEAPVNTGETLGSLGEMIETKVFNTVKEREVKLREAMNRSFEEQQRRWREQTEKVVERLREKQDKERKDFLEKLDNLQKMKDDLRKELEQDKRNLGAKLEDKQKAIDSLMEKHNDEMESLRASFEEKVQEERQTLLDEKAALENRFIEEKRSLEQHLEELRKRIGSIKDEESEKRDALLEKLEEEKGIIQNKFQTEKAELEQRLRDMENKIQAVREEESKKREEILLQHEEEKKKLEKEFENKAKKLEDELDQAKTEFSEERKQWDSRLTEEKELMERHFNQEKEDMKSLFQEEITLLKDLLEKERTVKIMEAGSEDETALRALEKKLMGPVYPFPAIVGQERMKRSLILNAINPNIEGVLLWGENGTAKKTAIFGLAELLSDIEEGVDPDTARLWDDPQRYSMGNLASTSANVSYLFDDVLMNGALCTKMVKDDGESRIIVVKEIPEKDKKLLSYIDSFNLHVKIEPSHDIDRRMEVVRRHKEFRDDPHAFHDRYDEEIKRLRDRIVQTRQILPSVTIHSSQRATISKVCAHNDLPSGMDIIIEEISRTITAYDGRDDVMDEDIQEALDLALVHRVTGDL